MLSFSSRRSAKRSVWADGRSSHWKSSTATRTGVSSASAVRTSRTASPTARGSTTLSPSDPSIMSAASSARRRSAPSPGNTSAATGLSSSAIPAKERTASASTARCARTRVPRALAPSRPACQSSVLPMPGSPESTSTEGAAAARSRKSSSDRTSLSRPLSSVVMAAGAILPPSGRPKYRGFQLSGTAVQRYGRGHDDHRSRGARSAEGFSGEILAPGDAGYDAARKIHNGLIDKRPALIARCRNTADVVAAVERRAGGGPRDLRARRRAQRRRQGRDRRRVDDRPLAR